MDVWLYSAPEKLWALTNDSEGGNLPDDLGPWVPVRPVVLREDASDEQQAIQLIAEHGFCCFD